MIYIDQLAISVNCPPSSEIIHKGPYKSFIRGKFYSYITSEILLFKNGQVLYSVQCSLRDDQNIKLTHTIDRHFISFSDDERMFFGNHHICIESSRKSNQIPKKSQKSKKIAYIFSEKDIILFRYGILEKYISKLYQGQYLFFDGKEYIFFGYRLDFDGRSFYS